MDRASDNSPHAFSLTTNHYSWRIGNTTLIMQFFITNTIKGVLLTAVMLAGIPSAIIAMRQDSSGVSHDAVTGPKVVDAPQASSQENNDVDINGSLPLFDINGDGILDRFSTSWATDRTVFISEGDSYVKKTIQVFSDYIYMRGRFEYVYQLNDEVIVGLMEYSNEQSIITFGKTDFKQIDGVRISKHTPFDIDNDGQTEFITKITKDYVSRDIYYKIEPDGRIVSHLLQLYTPETEAEDEEPEETGRSFVAWDYSMLGASMAQMFGRDGGGYGSVISPDNIFQITDLNGDGLNDIVRLDESKIYINIGNGTYYPQSFSGSTFFADFNGDGICDYVVADGTELVCYLTDPEGGKASAKTILSGFTLDNLWCRDVDKDGDSDLILLVSGTNQCFGVIMENNGKGSFKRREYSLQYLNNASSSTLYDWDNDGNYEILSVYSDKSNSGYYVLYSTKITGTTIETTPTTFDSLKGLNYIKPEPAVGKINRYSLSSNYGLLSDNYNNRPTAPASAPQVVYESKTGLVKISWTAGSDVETPVADLTYSIRIGTTPGACDVVNAQAKADGTRLWPGEGNVGRMLYHIYDTSSWPQGKLYISVQTVDGNMQGSAFSAEAIFEKTVPPCEFQMDYCDNFAVNDTLTLTINRMGGTPQWSVDDGKIVGSAGNIFKVVFPTKGEKTVALTVTDDAGNLSAPRSRMLKVLEAPVHKSFITEDMNGEMVELKVWTTFDMDEDGTDEIYSRGGFRKGDGNGVYRKIEKMFNSHNYISKFYGSEGTGTFDINRDGLCDIAHHEYLGYNLGELDMDFENTGGGLAKWLDIDNDGLYDAVGNGGAYRNDGDYKSFKNNHIYFGDATIFGDFNHDGLIDMADATKRGKTVYIFYNNGDFTFTAGETIVLPDNFDYNGLKVVEDIDLDGKIDVLFQNQYHYDGKYFWTLLLGNGDVIKRPGIISGVYDFNNDGIKEIVINDSGDGLKQSICYLSNGCLRTEIFPIKGPFGEGSYILSDGSRHMIRWDTDRGVINGASSLKLSVDNERPLPPTNLRHTQNEKFIVISWDHSVDKETPPAQMRYNISVKHKGATGEGAYVFSPANSGKNGVRVPLHKPLLHSNCITVPIANLPKGDYEVKVQGVDLMHDQSDFSETYEMHVAESSTVDAPTSGEVNVPVRIKVLSNTDVDKNWDGGEVKNESSGVYEVAWTTPGIKTITVNGQQSKIKIDAAPDPAFTFPEGIRYGDVVRFKGSQVNSGSWYSVESKYSGEYNPDDGWIYVDEETNLFTPNKFADFEIIDSETASITFKKYNGVVIRHKIGSSFSVQTCDRGITIPYDNNISGVSQKEETVSNPSIDYVTADFATGKYTIRWTNPEKIRPEAIGILVYRETAIANKYQLLAELPLDATEYTDNGSTPDIMASRYVIAYKLSFGRSCYSKAHQPVHVMINRGAGSSWNLIWGSYEGATIPQYRILRGNTPETLQCIAEVSGYTTSYTDNTAPSSGSLYYAVESVLKPETMNAPFKKAPRAASGAPRSNVVAAAGSDITLAETIKVLSADGNTNITGSEAIPASVQLIALIGPKAATFSKPSWIVVSGEDVVTVDKQGRVTATGKGNGTATVRAMTIDGSGLWADINISVSEFSGVDAIIDESAEMNIKVYSTPNMITLSGLGEGEKEVCIFSLGGRIVFRTITDGGSLEVDSESWAAGFYIAKVSGKDGSNRTVKFTKK